MARHGCGPGPSATQEDQPSAGSRECGAPLSKAVTVPNKAVADRSARACIAEHRAGGGSELGC